MNRKRGAEPPRRLAVTSEWRPRQCAGKVGWPKRKQALGALNTYRRQHPDDPRLEAMSVYKCGHCHKFHIGHSSRRVA